MTTPHEVSHRADRRRRPGARTGHRRRRVVAPARGRPRRRGAGRRHGLRQGRGAPRTSPPSRSRTPRRRRRSPRPSRTSATPRSRSPPATSSATATAPRAPSRCAGRCPVTCRGRMPCPSASSTPAARWVVATPPDRLAVAPRPPGRPDLPGWNGRAASAATSSTVTGKPLMPLGTVHAVQLDPVNATAASAAELEKVVGADEGVAGAGAGQGHGVRVEGADPGDHLPRRRLGAAARRGSRHSPASSPRPPSSRSRAPARSRSRCSAPTAR